MAGEKERVPAAGKENLNEKKSSSAFTIFSIILSFLIIGGILGGTFFYVIKNNLNGVADRYRNEIGAVPLIKMALPQPKDPEDPKYLTAEEFKAKYEELRKVRDAQKTQIDELTAKVAELQKVKDSVDTLTAEQDKRKTELDTLDAALKKTKEELAAQKKTLDEAIAKIDTASFKAYYEKADPEVAKSVYASIVKTQQTSAEMAKIAKIYEGMDAASASAVFEKWGVTKIDDITAILKAMKPASASAVIASMTPAFATKVTDKMTQLAKQ